MITIFLFQLSGFAQIQVQVLSFPSAGEVQTNHNAQTVEPGVVGAGILIAGSLIAESSLTAAILRLGSPRDDQGYPTFAANEIGPITVVQIAKKVPGQLVTDQRFA